MSRQQPDGPEVAGFPVDLGSPGAPEGVGDESLRIKADTGDPLLEDTGILPGREVWAGVARLR